MPHVITLTGPSGCGKTTAIDFFLANQKEEFRPVVIRKYSTRISRPDDGAEIVAGLSALPDKCDLVYEQYGARYGLMLSDVFGALKRGESPIVILNDVRAVEDIRGRLRRLVRSIFLFRSDPDKTEMMALARVRGGGDDASKRFEKARAIYRIYIENIWLFDHVVLNKYTERELEVQIQRIIGGLGCGENWPLRDKEP